MKHNLMHADDEQLQHLLTADYFIESATTNIAHYGKPITKSPMSCPSPSIGYWKSDPRDGSILPMPCENN